jgi:hypothetical protein
MSNLLLRTFLALTFVFAASVYGMPACQAGALTGVEEAAGKGLAKVGKKVGKKVRHWWDNEPEPVQERIKEAPLEPFKECFVDGIKRRDCKGKSN